MTMTKTDFIEILKNASTMNAEESSRFKVIASMYSQFLKVGFTATEARTCVARMQVNISDSLIEDQETFTAVIEHTAMACRNIKSALNKIDKKLFADFLKYGDPIKLEFTF